jgi:UPF0755 protein
MVRAIAANGLTVLIFLGVVAAGLLNWGQTQYRGVGPLEQAVCLRVAPGSNMSRVSDQLAGQGAITSATVFRLGAQYTERASQLKAGSFLIDPGASMEDITRAITEGGRSTCGTEVNFRIGILRADVLVRELDPATGDYVESLRFDPGEETPEAFATVMAEPDVRLRVTLAEGVSSWQVIEELGQAAFLTGEVAAVPPEGSLAPDSYEVQQGDDRSALVARMSERQAQIVAELWAARAPDLPVRTPQEALILASIVEKETSVPEERRQVASVFVNRLRDGMRLQTDPTVIYGITQGQGALGRGLRRSELDRRTPWNTYQIDGLPPTPIANPGRLSIAAALNPDDTDFLFFVADGTGGHAFAQTLAEHNRNVARWRQIEAERNAN